MKVEKHYKGIRYTLSNENLQQGDKVYPIARGRVIANIDWMLCDFDYSESCSGFPNEPHTILNLKHSDYKPYEIQTDFGFGPVEQYFKIIKKEKQIVENPDGLFKTYKWIEITD